MSEFFPIQIRHLDEVVNPLSGTDVFPLQIGNNIDGFETRAAQINDVLQYINQSNQNTNISTLVVGNSALVGNLLYIGNIEEIPGVKLYVDGDTIISGSLSALSGVTYFNTNIAETTALFLSGASGVSLKVLQEFEFPIAQFFDSQNIALHIDGSSERAGYVGIKTDLPNEALTVVGNISSSSNIYGLHASTESAFVSGLSAYNLYVIGSSFLESESGANLTIGNLSSSNINIVGDVLINALSSDVEFKTVIGNEKSDVYIEGYTFLNSLSTTGNLYINNIDGQNYELNVGNIDAINNITGTTILSGNIYNEGNVNLNVQGENDTFINSIDNTGSVFIGNPNNTTNIKANRFSHNTTLTSELISITFSENEFDSLTSTVETIFSDLNIVYFLSGVNFTNPSISSVQYKYLEDVEGLFIDLSQDSARLGNSNFATEIQGETISSTAGSLLSLYTLSGGIVKLGENDNNLEINGFSVKINDDSSGISKSTYINTSEDSGNVEIGNPTNYTLINGLSTYVNTLCAANTVIGNLSGTVEVYNLTVYNSLSALIDTFNISNINTQNIVSSNIATLNNVNINGNLNNIGNAYFANSLGIGSQPTEALTVVGNITASGKVYSDNGNSDIWNKPNINFILPLTDEQGIVSVQNSIAQFISPHTFVLNKIKLGINQPAEGSSIVATLSSITNDAVITTINLEPNTYTATNNSLSYSLTEDERICVNIEDVGSTFNGAGLKLYLTGKYV